MLNLVRVHQRESERAITGSSHAARLPDAPDFVHPQLYLGGCHLVPDAISRDTLRYRIDKYGLPAPE